ncbi:uncharacterized protein [Procambarus clarkii]|uniref:uncharacterized protein n=1 Tax=Procambarus clarkii TaxID=6728 RepID=UPI0037432B05
MGQYPKAGKGLRALNAEVFLHILEEERAKIKELGELGAGVDVVRELGAGVDVELGAGVNVVRELGAGVDEVRELGAGVDEVRELGAGVDGVRELGAGVDVVGELGAGVDEVRELGAGVDEVRELGAGVDEVRELGAGVDVVRELGAGVDVVGELGAGVDEVRELGAGVDEVRELGAGVDEVRELGAGVDEVRELGAGVDVVRELGAGVDEVRELSAGVDEVISTIRGEAPWRACWPQGRSVVSLTQLMVQAARAKCTLTCSFLHLAGAQSSLCSKSGASPLHAALDAGHWELAARMVKDMDGSLYVPDPTGRLPTVTLPPHLAHSLEQSIYNKERNKLQDLLEKTKHPSDKDQVQEILDVQEILFTSYFKKTAGARGSRVRSTGPQALLVASRSGLQQLIYLLVKVGGLAVDTLVDPTGATTALHQAAAHGKSGCVLLLLSLGAQPLLPDRYGHTPPHLAAMFGHQHTYQLLAEFIMEPQPFCRAGTTPQEVCRHFSQYLQKYNIRETVSSADSEHINNDPTEAAMNLLRRIHLRNLVRDLEKTTVDFTMREAQEVKDEVMRELQQITENVSNKTFRGELRLSGSAADGTRLYCPDEFDVNFVLQKLSGVEVKVIQQTEKEVLASGHKLKVKIKTKNASLHGNNLVTKFYDEVGECLKNYTIGDKRLSLVPPGLTRTQVGVALSLAWQGSEYPLLLVSVDLVPVVVVPWPEEISRPPLTPDSSQIIQLSNTEDGSWRCSLAATEVEVLQQLEPQERRVFLTCKTLLSRLKAEPWMPRHVKNQFSWWDSRYWKVPTPTGFCLKNSFLRQLQRKREQGIDWHEQDILIIVKSVFKDMCHEMDDPSTVVESLVPAKVNAYFGGDCEKPKMGEGAPEIVSYLDTV